MPWDSRGGLTAGVVSFTLAVTLILSAPLALPGCKGCVSVDTSGCVGQIGNPHPDPYDDALPGSDYWMRLDLGLTARPEVALLAVTTVNTDPPMRARIAAKILRAYGRGDVAVAAGEKEMFDGAATYCKDINGAVVVTLDDPVPGEGGVDLMVETIMANPGEVTVVGIGCWTNVARAFEKAPALETAVGRLVLMGGKVSPPGTESNVVCDPAAAEYVLNLPVEKVLVPLDVTMACRYRAARRAGLMAAANCRTSLIADLVRAWQIGRHGGDHAAEPVLHDPLAVGVAFDDSLVLDSRPMHVVVVPGAGVPVTDSLDGGLPNARVVMKVDTGRFEDLFAERMLL